MDENKFNKYTKIKRSIRLGYIFLPDLFILYSDAM